MRHFLSIIGLLAVTTLSVGCAVGPHSPEPSVTADAMDFLKREWPLAGPPVLTPEQRAGHGCSCCSGGCSEVNDSSCEPDECVLESCFGGSNGRAVYVDPVPAVPLEPGPPGRFFPVPVRPVFAPQPPVFQPMIGVPVGLEPQGEPFSAEGG